MSAVAETAEPQSEDYYNGANLSTRGDVVIATINYRLGALGSGHARELPFVFDTQGTAPEFAGSELDADAFAETTMDTWLAFARTGNPTAQTTMSPMLPPGTPKPSRSWSWAQTSDSSTTVAAPKSAPGTK